MVERPWKKLLKIQDKTDRALFFNSTYMLVGNGQNTPFWEAKWLQGAAPKDLAPKLFRVARFRRRNVAAELVNHNWGQNFKRLNTPILVEEFVMLFMALAAVQLNEEKDQIFWRWTNDGNFSVASAYDCQFLGAMTSFPATKI